MRYCTVLPVDKNGNPVPVFIPDTERTQKITVASVSTPVAATAFSGTTKTMASYTTTDIFSGTNYMTFTAKIEGYPSENISIEIVDAGDNLTVTISGYAITIAGATNKPTCSEIIAAFEADEAINKLVAVTCTDVDATLNSGAVARTFLSGWDDGKTPTIVRICPTAACLIHIGVVASTSAATTQMYIPAGFVEYVALMPGELISVLGVAADSFDTYITPARRF
jgi:hypothetical protein